MSPQQGNDQEFATSSTEVSVQPPWINNVPASLQGSSIQTTTSQTEPTTTAAPESTTLLAHSTGTSGENNGKSGVSTGVVAGVAIATAIIGAGIAFLVAFLLFKRRNRGRDASGRPVKYEAYGESTPEFIMATKDVGTGRRDSSYVQVSQTPAPAHISASMPMQQPNSSDVLAKILPPAADEHNIQSRVAALFGDIHGHIDAYYRDVHASITSSMEPELALFGAKDVNMAELLQDCSTPTVALKHALVAYVLGITGPKNEGGGETLFPEELGGVRIDDDVTDPNRNIASTLHRRLSVYLYNANASNPSNARSSWALASNMREAAEHFSLAFFPWANPTASDQDKDEGLAHIISSTFELRIWLFGQPNVYEFVWEGSGRRGVVVSPALMSRTDGRLVLEMGVVGT